jgi:hypothetical protein
MLLATDTSYAPRYVVSADDKRQAWLNCVSHLLSLIPYKELEWEKVKLPDWQKFYGYEGPKNRSYNVGLKCFDDAFFSGLSR